MVFLKKEFKPSVSSVQSLSHVWLFVIPWTTAHQASLSITNSRSLRKLMSIELVIPSNYFILCHTLLLLPSIFPSIRVFSNESVLHIRWPKCWSFSFNISPSNEYSGLIGLLAVNRNSLKLKFCVTIFSCLFKNHWLKTYMQHIYADTQAPKPMWHMGANLYSYLNQRCLLNFQTLCGLFCKAQLLLQSK